MMVTCFVVIHPILLESEHSGLIYAYENGMMTVPFAGFQHGSYSRAKGYFQDGIDHVFLSNFRFPAFLSFWEENSGNANIGNNSNLWNFYILVFHHQRCAQYVDQHS